MAYLRRDGFAVGPAESELVLSVLAAQEFPDAAAVRLALKTLLSGNREQWAHFDELFDGYWFGRGLRGVAAAQAGSVRNRSARPEIWDKVLPREENCAGNEPGRTSAGERRRAGRKRHRSTDRKPQ